MKTIKILNSEEDVKREVRALTDYLQKRGFNDTTELLSFFNLYLTEMVAVSLYRGGVSKDELANKTKEFLKYFFDDVEIEAVVRYVLGVLDDEVVK